MDEHSAARETATRNHRWWRDPAWLNVVIAVATLAVVVSLALVKNVESKVNSVSTAVNSVEDTIGSVEIKVNSIETYVDSHTVFMPLMAGQGGAVGQE